MRHVVIGGHQAYIHRFMGPRILRLVRPRAVHVMRARFACNEIINSLCENNVVNKLCCLFFMQLGHPWELFPFVSFRYSSWKEYLKAMRQDGIDGDHMILVAVANYYKTCICVLNTQSQKTIIRPKCVVDNSKMLVLGHVPELHYVSLRPEQGNPFFVCGHRC